MVDQHIFWLMLFLLLAGCQVLDPPDRVATLQAENINIVQEATAIAQSAQRDRDRIQDLAVSAMTEVGNIQQSNLVLLATVRAGDPVEERVVANADIQLAQITPGQRWFVRTGVSNFINEADGCVVSPQIAFSADASPIYATVRAFNIEPGVQMSVQWDYEGAEVHREGFTLQQGGSDICLWFSIDQTLVDFAPGNWAVRMFADGFQLETPMTFSIREGDEMMEDR